MEERKKEKEGKSNNRSECSMFPNNGENNTNSTKFLEVKLAYTNLILQSFVCLEYGILQKKMVLGQ